MKDHLSPVPKGGLSRGTTYLFQEVQDSCTAVHTKAKTLTTHFLTHPATDSNDSQQNPLQRDVAIFPSKVLGRIIYQGKSSQNRSFIANWRHRYTTHYLGK